MIGLSQRALERPAFVLRIAAVGLVLAAGLCTQLQLDNDPRKLAPTDAARDAANERHEKLFGADDTLLLLILTDSNVERLIKAVEEVETSIVEMAEVLRVRSPCSVEVPMDQDGATVFTPAFGSASELKGDTAERVKSLQQWTGGKGLVSADGQHMVLAIRLQDQLQDPSLALSFVESLEKLVSETLEDGTESHLGGLLATRIGSVRAIIRDGLLLFPLAGLVVFLVALSRFRSVRWTLILVACLVWSITLTAGFAAALGYALNPLTQIFPILLLIIGIADGVHLVERVAEASTEPVEGTDLTSAWRTSLAETGAACVLTTATTAIGFLALFATSIPVLHEFALIVSVGVCFSLLANLFVLPALCLRFAKKTPPIAARRGALFARIAAYSHRHGAAVLVAGAVVLGVSLQQYGKVEVDFFLSKVLSEKNAVSDGNAILLRQFGGSIPLEVTVETTAGDFNDPEHLKSLQALTEFLNERGWVAASQATALSKIRAVFTGEESLPASREEAAQLDLTLEAAKLAPLLGEDPRVARLTAIGPDIGGRKLLELKEELASFAATLPSIQVTAVGSMLAAAEGFGSLVHELIIGLFIALMAVIVLIGFNLRSARAALASALPNSLPIALGLAFFALTGRYLDIFSAIFFTIALGIAVDDTIHMLSRYQLERSRCDTEAQALERAASQVGTAVADTSWILISGFALLMLSNFPANRLSGGLASGLIAAALLCDLILVPAGIRVFRLGGNRS